MKVFNVKESSYILQQIYLTKKEIKNLFNCCVSEKSKSNQMTPKAMLETTSTVTSLRIPQQKQVPLTETLPRKPFPPEPQNDPYWMVKRSGAISKCRGCKESLNEVVMGRIEIDFFPKVDPMKQIKYWAVSKEAAYYHVNISCLRKHRPTFVLARNKLKLSEGVEINKGAEISLGLE